MSYGKSKVRLARLVRADRHEFSDAEVTVRLDGDFSATHLRGDNAGLMATDTMRNVVYALAAENPGEPSFELAARLGRHYLGCSDLVSRVHITIAERRWDRLTTDGNPHPHAFVSGGDETAISEALTDRATGVRFAGGIGHLTLLKTTGSAFRGFARDRHTTLPETADRIMASSIDVRWTFSATDVPRAALHAELRALIVDTFINSFSDSVQQTAYTMGARLIENTESIAEVHLSLPNLHYIPFDVSRFDQDGSNAIFVATTEPHGQINVTVVRDGATPPQ